MKTLKTIALIAILAMTNLWTYAQNEPQNDARKASQTLVVNANQNVSNANVWHSAVPFNPAWIYRGSNKTGEVHHTQTIYLAKYLTNMVGSKISKISFRGYNQGNAQIQANWNTGIEAKITLGHTVAGNVYNDWLNVDRDVIQPKATLPNAVLQTDANQLVTFTFDPPLNYEGGNLVFDLNRIAGRGDGGGSTTPNGAFYVGRVVYSADPNDNSWKIPENMVTRWEQYMNNTDPNFTPTGNNGATPLFPEITFTYEKYEAVNITASATRGGSITPVGVSAVEKGKQRAYSFVADANYRVDSVFINGVYNPQAVANGGYVFTNVQEASTIHVVFTGNEYTIEASVNATANKGTIEPSGDVPVYYGGLQTFEFTPNPGYIIKSVKVNGVFDEQARKDGSYTFYNISGNSTIEVAFSEDGWILTPNIYPDSNFDKGAISPAEAQVVSKSGSAIMPFIFAPNDGYQVKWVKIDGEENEEAKTTGTYVFRNINADHSIEVAFEKAATRYFNIALSSTGCGTFEPTELDPIAEGEDGVLIQMVAPSGQSIQRILVDGEECPDCILSGRRGEYRFTNVKKNHTLHADFTGDCPAWADIQKLEVAQNALVVYPNPVNDELRITNYELGMGDATN